MLRGPQNADQDLTFSVPSVCADRLESRDVDIGLVPCAELHRLGLHVLPDVGIGCRGAVRSILLVSKVDPGKITTLAADSGSRTSVMLTRIILDRVYGVRPAIISMRPQLEPMLGKADAALIIGDPALQLDPASLPYQVLDLGLEWLNLSGLPMVFAVWAGTDPDITNRARRTFIDSCRYGLDHMADIVAEAPRSHGVPTDLAKKYLTQHIQFELDDRDHRGLTQYLEWAAELDPGYAPAASDVAASANL